MFFKLFSAMFAFVVLVAFLLVGWWLEKTSAPMRRFYIYECRKGVPARRVGIQWARTKTDALAKFLEDAAGIYRPDGTVRLEAREAPED